MTERLDAGGAALPPLERRLHEIDAELNRIRQRMFLVEHGIAPSDDRDGELTALRHRFDELSDEFVVAYRRWNSPDYQRDGE